MLVPGIAEKYVATEQDVLGEAQRRTPEYAEFLKASVADAFERTTTDAALTGQAVWDAEKKAYGDQAPGYQEQLWSDSFGGTEVREPVLRAAPQEAGQPRSGAGVFQVEPGRIPGGTWPATASAAQEVRPSYILKEEWNEKHTLYRKGVEWRENFTPERAQIYAEDVDKREFRQMLLQQGKSTYGLWKGLVPGFFAGMLGSLPDPVNLVPFGRAVGSGKGFVAGVKTGIVDGALSNAVVDAFVLPGLKSRGADVGFADFALDITFGAALGGLLGGGGGWLGARREARAAEVSRAWKAAQEAENAGMALEHRQTHGAFELAGRDRLFDGESVGANEAAPPSSTEAFLSRNEVTDGLRQSIHGEARQTLLRASDMAQDQFSRGEAVNVEGVYRESTAMARLYEQALFNPLLAADPHSPQVRLMYAELARSLDVELGDIHVNIGNAFISESGGIEARSAFGMLKFIWRHGEASTEPRKMQVTKEDVFSFPHVLREYIPTFNEQGGYQWVVQAADGRILRYIAKDFTETDGKSHLVTIHVITKGQAKRNGFSKKIADAVSSHEGFAPSGKIPQGELTNQAFAPPRSPKGQESAIHQLGSENIGARVGNVNRFAGETAPEFPPAPPLARRQDAAGPRSGAGMEASPEFPSKEASPTRASASQEVRPSVISQDVRAALDELGVDPKTGLTLEEVRAMEQVEQNRAHPEEVDAFLRAREEEGLRQQMEDAGFAVMECIMGVKE